MPRWVIAPSVLLNLYVLNCCLLADLPLGNCLKLGTRVRLGTSFIALPEILQAGPSVIDDILFANFGTQLFIWAQVRRAL